MVFLIHQPRVYYYMDEQIFLKLVARQLSGEANAEDLKELQRYIDSDDGYSQKFKIFQEYWRQKNNIQTDTSIALQKVLNQINEGSSQSSNDHSIGRLKSKQRVRMFMRISTAAIIMLACIAAAWYIFHKANKTLSVQSEIQPGQFQVKETEMGSRSSIILSDGTKVTLNADSKLTYPKIFKGSTREVILSGEAYFDVVHDEKIPFIIHTQKLNIKVLGTEFNVKSYPEDSISETTLIRGLIEVTLNSRPSDKIILRPKEKLIVSNETTESSKTPVTEHPEVRDTRLVISNLHYVSATDSAVVETSWLKNKLVFQNKSFSDLATDLERRYNVQIEFRNNAVKEFRFTGIFEKENIDQILKALSLTEKFNYSREGSKIIIY